MSSLKTATDTFDDDSVPSKPGRPTMPSSFVSSHALASKKQGDSEVEQVTLAIEQRREERIMVTLDVQAKLESDCKIIAMANNLQNQSVIPINALKTYRAQTNAKLQLQKKRPTYYLLKTFGFRVRSQQMMDVLDRALKLVEEDQAEEDMDFHYMDFCAYYTKVESRWPWMRNGVVLALVYIFLFYLATPIYFCLLVVDEGICPKQEDSGDHGWSSALYFASTTLSTVGYGDLTVDKTDQVKVFAGIIYMIAANITLVGAFGAAANAASGPFDRFNDRLRNWALGRVTSDTPLYIKLRRLKLVRVIQLSLQFVILTLIGVFANRLFLKYYDGHEGPLDKETLGYEWTWMISFYWAVQTVTTIGYGDLTQPDNQRWFNIFYLVLSTYYVGNALGELASLGDEIEQANRDYSWGRREVSKNLIDELQPEGHDGKIDQYEFLVASLVQLGKLSSEDVVPIMDKYRSLAGPSGFIEQEFLNQQAQKELQETAPPRSKEQNEGPQEQLPRMNENGELEAPRGYNNGQSKDEDPGDFTV